MLDSQDLNAITGKEEVLSVDLDEGIVREDRFKTGGLWF